MTTAYLNRIATHVPAHDVHDAFVRFAKTLLREDRERAVFSRMVKKSQIDHRYSVLAPAANPEGPSVDSGGLYTREAFPTTGERMKLFEAHAPELAVKTVEKLDMGFSDLRRVSHVIVTSCTGLYAPGLDLELVDRLGLDPSVERTMIGFMGCYAAINALKMARHVVRSEPSSRVLILNLELCSLHLQQATSLDQMLSFLIFGDGCAASLVTSDSVGLALDSFRAEVLPDTKELITWHVRDSGFDMHLSGRVPATIARGIGATKDKVLRGAAAADIQHWAVHPGGRTVLDAVEHGLELAPTALRTSRDVLARFGNMSSATVMFVLDDVLKSANPGESGCGMSFGPGLTAESFLFHKV